jgi:hypothetical protein
MDSSDLVLVSTDMKLTVNGSAPYTGGILKLTQTKVDLFNIPRLVPFSFTGEAREQLLARLRDAGYRLREYWQRPDACLRLLERDGLYFYSFTFAEMPAFGTLDFERGHDLVEYVFTLCKTQVTTGYDYEPEDFESLIDGFLDGEVIAAAVQADI